KISLILGTLSAALAALIYSSYPSITLFIIGETLLRQMIFFPTLGKKVIKLLQLDGNP
ncbi:unnamed protein product, partial [marine sediment metagenome]